MEQNDTNKTKGEKVLSAEAGSLLVKMLQSGETVNLIAAQHEESASEKRYLEGAADGFRLAATFAALHIHQHTENRENTTSE